MGAGHEHGLVILGRTLKPYFPRAEHIFPGIVPRNTVCAPPLVVPEHVPAAQGVRLVVPLTERTGTLSDLTHVA